jgi:two-component system, NarL family, sensor histidine kinase BarA
MAYQSLKRVLSETSLERKCRYLFGACLLLLIAIAFILVDQKAEELVYRTLQQERDNTRQRGRDSAVMSLLNLHFIAWAEKSEEDADKQLERELVEEIIRGLEGDTYQAEILVLDDNPKVGLRQPNTPWEGEVMEELLRDVRALPLPGGDDSTKESAAPGAVPGPDAEKERLKGVPRPGEFAADEGLGHVFRERVLADKGEYHFFQPVYFRESCSGCHFPPQSSGAVPASADHARLYRQFEPFRVIKVVLPYRESKAEVHQIRAILAAAGIIAFFVAMGTLYIIVRYVIVSPLKHLRDVSDAISRGKTELRADIHTNDEFEELGNAFNRMLRHLTETQVNLQKANVELDAKVDELAQLNMRLYEMNRLKSDFLANMSHELRTPLNSIIGFSEVLQGIESLSEKQKRYAQNIQKSGRVLLEMINDILDLAKIDAGKTELRPSEFRIESIVHAQCDMVRALTEEKNIDLSVEVAPNLPPLFQDQGKLQQVLTNLLSNAIKFTPEGGRITVRAQQDDQRRLLLTVADTGVGIADEDREIIFEKFRQSRAVVGEDGLTREYSGTGLGLSIVKELCKMLRGEIHFQSELGKGSTFVVTLPWTSDDLPPVAGSRDAAFRSERLSSPRA